MIPELVFTISGIPKITEIQLGQKVLNTMTALGRPVFERIA